MVTMPYNFYIQVVFFKEDRLSISHAVPEIKGFKERDGAGPGRAGPGRVGRGRAGSGGAGPGRAANTQIFPLNTKELAPLAALARS